MKNQVCQTKNPATAGYISISDDRSGQHVTEDHRDSSSIGNNAFLRSIYDGTEVKIGAAETIQDDGNVVVIPTIAYEPYNAPGDESIYAKNEDIIR